MSSVSWEQLVETDSKPSVCRNHCFLRIMDISWQLPD